MSSNELVMSVMLGCFTVQLVVYVGMMLKKLHRDKSGRLVRPLRKREKEYCWKVMDTIMYNMRYHSESNSAKDDEGRVIGTYQLMDYCYTTYEWMRELMSSGIPVLCGLYYLEKRTPTVFRPAYNNRVSKNKKPNNMQAIKVKNGKEEYTFYTVTDQKKNVLYEGDNLEEAQSFL